jgi:hypothetical protein
MNEKLSIKLSERAQINLKEMSTDLKKRNVKNPNFSKLINNLLEQLTKKEKQLFVEEETPLEWKVSQILKSEEGVKELKKLTNKIKSLPKKEKKSEQRADI